MFESQFIMSNNKFIVLYMLSCYVFIKMTIVSLFQYTLNIQNENRLLNPKEKVTKNHDLSEQLIFKLFKEKFKMKIDYTLKMK